MRNLKELGSHRICDCGGEKSRTAQACDECTWRDGATARETRIIDALRTAVEPIDVVRVASLSGTTERSVLRSIGSLLENGRVIRKEGPPTMYKLGEKRIPMSKKKQTELEGFERPCIEAIDDAIVELIDAKQQVNSWKMRAEEAQGALDERMLESEAKLEEIADGSRCYVFVDGESRHTAELPAPKEHRKTKISTKKIPREELEA